MVNLIESAYRIITLKKKKLFVILEFDSLRLQLLLLYWKEWQEYSLKSPFVLNRKIKVGFWMTWGWVNVGRIFNLGFLLKKKINNSLDGAFGCTCVFLHFSAVPYNIKSCLDTISVVKNSPKCFLGIKACTNRTTWTSGDTRLVSNWSLAFPSVSAWGSLSWQTSLTF